MSVRILQGDCRDVLKTLPDESVHCIVTSPPYWGLRDYGVAGQIGLEESPFTWLDAMVEVFAEARRVLRADGTCWVNMGDSYAKAGGPGWQGKNGQRADRRFTAVRDTVPLRNICRRPPQGLKPKDLIGQPWMLAFALRADGWWLRSDIIWAKKNCMPESVTDRPTKSHEYIFLLSKSERYYYDHEAIKELAGDDAAPGIGGWATGEDHTAAGFAKEGAPPSHGDLNKRTRTMGKHASQHPQSSGHRIVENVARARAAGGPHDNPFGNKRNKRSVWNVATYPFTEAHFATFPTELIEPCILAGCPEGGTVLDPFGGAGTTGLVADRLQRNAILIELNPEYAEMARRRIQGDAPLFAEVA